MLNKTFGKLTFDSGWEKRESIKIFDREYDIAVMATAYYESEGITSDQEEFYAFFEKNKDEILKKIQTKILLDVEDKAEAAKTFTPSTLLIQKDGSAALLFDREEDDEGLAFTISLEVKQVAQDSIL